MYFRVGNESFCFPSSRGRLQTADFHILIFKAGKAGEIEWSETVLQGVSMIANWPALVAATRLLYSFRVWKAFSTLFVLNG